MNFIKIMFLKKYENFRFLILLNIVLICCMSCGDKLETRFKKLVSEGDSSFAHREYKKALVPWGEALKIKPASVDVLKKNARAYLRLAEFSRAEKLFTQIIQNQPNADDILLELTKLQLVTGKISDALKNWNELNSRYPDDPSVKVLYGDLLVLEGRYDEAESIYKDAVMISNNSNNIIVLIKLAACYLSQDKPDMAQATFKAATAKKTESIDELLQIANYWKLSNNMVKAELSIRKALELEPEDLSLQMKLARFYFDIKRYQDSRMIIEKLIELAPENRALLKYLLKILLTQNQLEKIPFLLEENKIAMKNDPEFNLLAGKYYLVKNNPSIAEEYFNRVTRDQPNHFLAHYFLGITYLLGEHVYLAQQSFIKALAFNPSFFEAEIALADINYQDGEYDVSYEYSKRVIEKEPKNYRAHLVMGNVLLAKKQYTNALVRFRTAFSINPDSLSAIYYIALTNEYLNKKEKAIELFQGLLKKNPDLADAAWRLKELLIETGKIERAGQYFKLVVDKSPKNGYLHYIIGEIYLADGNTSKAIECFNNAIGLLPDLSSSYIKLAGIYAGLKRWEKQTDILKLCINNIPAFLDSYFQLAQLYMQKERWDDAIKVLEIALIDNPDSPLLASNLAYLYLESDQNINKAFELARSAYEKMPENPAVVDTFGWVYYKKNMFVQAVNHFKYALEFSPDNEVVAGHLALAEKALESK